MTSRALTPEQEASIGIFACRLSAELFRSLRCVDTVEPILRDLARTLLEPVEKERDEARVIIAACGAEMDEIRAKARGAEFRRQAAEYRARRIVLDAELQGELAKTRRELAEAREENTRLREQLDRK